MNEWIRVRDRLPEEKEPVIILLQDGQIFRGEIHMRRLSPEWWYYYEAAETDMDMLWFSGNPVIAWMPIPELPKEDTD